MFHQYTEDELRELAGCHGFSLYADKHGGFSIWKSDQFKCRGSLSVVQDWLATWQEESTAAVHANLKTCEERIRELTNAQASTDRRDTDKQNQIAASLLGIRGWQNDLKAELQKLEEGTPAPSGGGQ